MTASTYFVVCGECGARWTGHYQVESAPPSPRQCRNRECRGTWLDLSMFMDEADADRAAAAATDPHGGSRGPDGVIGQDADYLERIADAEAAAAERTDDDDFVESKVGRLDANEHRIILAALETYQSMWAVAVAEARREGEAVDERLMQGRYDEAGELLAKFRAERKGADPASVAALDRVIARQQASDRELSRR